MIKVQKEKENEKGLDKRKMTKVQKEKEKDDYGLKRKRK